MTKERTRTINSADIDKVIIEETIKINEVPAIQVGITESKLVSQEEYTEEQRRLNREALKKLHPDIAWARGFSPEKE